MSHPRAKEAIKQSQPGFTILELLVVVAIIAILAGLVISTAGYIQNRVARSRAESEIASMEAALQSYKTEMGEYPAWVNGTPTSGKTPPAAPSDTNAGNTNVLIAALSPPSGMPTNNPYNPQKKIFYNFPNSMVTNTPNNYTNAILDPFGNSYGYCCPGTYNTASFDLWSIAGSATNTNLWIKNW